MPPRHLAPEEEKIDRVSAALAVAAGTCMVIVLATKPTPEKTAAMAVSTLAWIGYDRWHDGLWPFTDVERQHLYL
jgi:hypothetical protein